MGEGRVNGRETIVTDDRATVTTTVRRHRVRLEFDRRELGAVICGLVLLAADDRQHEANRALARELLWRVVDDANGPSRTIDRRSV
jgi:hypothetical protein